MKKVNFWAMFTLLFVALVPLFTSCTEETVDDGDGDGNTSKASVSFKQSEITVSADETVYKMGYTIANAGEDFIVEGNSENDWISDFKTSTKNVLEFTISKNEGEAREGKVELLYICGKDSARASFAVKQEAAKEEEFALSIGETGSSWAEFTLTPKDKNMKYMLSYMEADVMDGYVSDEALLNDELKNYKDIADYYGMAIEDVLNILTVSGDLSDVAFVKLDADKEYYAYCYGFDSSWGISTSVVKKKFKTTAIGDIDLKIEFKNIVPDKYSATFEISTNTYDSYVFAYGEKSVVEEMGDEELVKFLSQDGLSFYGGNESINLDGLTPNTEYVLFAMGRVGNVKTTDLFKGTFKTQEAVQSSVTLSLTHKHCDAASFHEKYNDVLKPNDYTGQALWALNFETEGVSYIFGLYNENILGVPDEQILGILLSDENAFSGETKYGPILLTGPIGFDAYLCAVAKDSQGNYSAPYRSGHIVLDEASACTIDEMAQFIGIGEQRSNAYIAPWLNPVKSISANRSFINRTLKKVNVDNKLEKVMKISGINK